MNIYRSNYAQSGVSLIQVLIMSAILSAMALVGVQITQNTKMTSKGVEVRNDIDTLHSTVLSALQDQVNCTASYLHCTSSNSLCLAGPNATGAGNRFLQENQSYMSDRVIVNDIDFTVPASGDGNIRIVYANKHADKGKQGFSARSIEKNIPIKVIRDGATFVRCYVDPEGVTEELTQEFCTSLGAFATWDSVAKKCNLNQQTCPNGLIFMGVESTGAPICRTIQDNVDADQYFSNNSTANCPNRESIQLIVGGDGKIQIQCNSASTPPCLPVDGTWSYSSWGTCDPATLTQTRTATCANATCGGTCGLQDPVVQPCTVIGPPCYTNCFTAGYDCQWSTSIPGTTTITTCSGVTQHCGPDGLSGFHVKMCLSP